MLIKAKIRGYFIISVKQLQKVAPSQWRVIEMIGLGMQLQYVRWKGVKKRIEKNSLSQESVRTGIVSENEIKDLEFSLKSLIFATLVCSLVFRAKGAGTLFHHDFQ